MDDAIKTSGLIFMKVGLHAQESIEDIIKRKQREFEETGSIFWGYGGPTCHPRNVRAFAKEVEGSGNQVLIVMQKMNSKHAAPPEIAKEYSYDDGVNWQPIPKGIEVRGSRYALVLEELQTEEFDLDLSQLKVGVGPSRGRRGDQYLVRQVDKGCFLPTPQQELVVQEKQVLVPIGLKARVKAPYAVLLK